MKIETGNTDESLFRLYNYQADLALLGRDVDDERLLSLPLPDDRLLAFVARNHPWAGRESICLADLDDTPLVLREIGSVTRQTLEQEMSQAGFASARRSRWKAVRPRVKRWWWASAWAWSRRRSSAPTRGCAPCRSAIAASA